MTSQIPILDDKFHYQQFINTRNYIQRGANMNACNPPSHPGRLHPFLWQVMAVIRETDAAPGFDPPSAYHRPPILFPEHVRFMTAEEVLARWGWEEREAQESPEYYGSLVELLHSMQADASTAELAWERLSRHGWAPGPYYRFYPDDEDDDSIGLPADVDLDEEGSSIGDPTDVNFHNEANEDDWEDEASDDADSASPSASPPTLPANNGMTEEDLAGFDPIIRARILRNAAEDAEGDHLSDIETIDEIVSDRASAPATSADADMDEPTEGEIRAWATGVIAAPSQWEDYEEEEEEEDMETTDDEGWETDEDEDEDDEIVWPGWAAPGVGYPNPADHAFPMYLVPHIMHENAWNEGSMHYIYVRGRLVCCDYSGPPRRFDGCQGRRVGDDTEADDEDDGAEE